MWARCFSSRRTSPFSAMIWRTFRTVVYCVGLRRTMASWTARTVEAPRLQRMVRISSSASVGRGGSGGLEDIYEDCTTKSVVESRRKCRATLIDDIFALDGGSGVCVGQFVVAGTDQVRAVLGRELAAVFQADEAFAHVTVFRGGDHVLGLGRENPLDFLFGAVDAVGIHGVSSQDFGDGAGLGFLHGFEFLKDTDSAGGIVAGGIHVLDAKVVGFRLVVTAEAAGGHGDGCVDCLAGAVTRPAAHKDAGNYRGHTGDLRLGSLAGHVARGHVGDFVRQGRS